MYLPIENGDFSSQSFQFPGVSKKNQRFFFNPPFFFHTHTPFPNIPFTSLGSTFVKTFGLASRVFSCRGVGRSVIPATKSRKSHERGEISPMVTWHVVGREKSSGRSSSLFIHHFWTVFVVFLTKNSWWLRPSYLKHMLVKLDHLPQIGVKIKHIWNHHLVQSFFLKPLLTVFFVKKLLGEAEYL